MHAVYISSRQTVINGLASDRRSIVLSLTVLGRTHLGTGKLATANDEYSKFRKLMEELPPGKIGDSSDVAFALSNVWSMLDGADQEGMDSEKIIGRMEEVVWEPPVLSFMIERHGGLILGSVCAELHEWSVNVEKRKAIVRVGHKRLKGKKLPPLKVDPLVDEVVELIIAGKQDIRLKWRDDQTRVQVQVEKIIPGHGVAKRTLEGRRQQFGRRLTELMAQHGWQKRDRPYHTYVRAPRKNATLTEI